MAATIVVIRRTGTAGAPTDTNVSGITSVHSFSDEHVAASPTYPAKRPTSGTNRTHWMSIRLRCDVTPAGTVNNVRVYADGTGFGTGITLNGQTANVGADAGYRQATGAAGSSHSTLNTTNHTGLTGAPVEVFANWTAGSPKSLTASISNPSTGLFGDYLVFQVELISSAAAGTPTAETMTLLYDET